MDRNRKHCSGKGKGVFAFAFAAAKDAVCSFTR